MWFLDTDVSPGWGAPLHTCFGGGGRKSFNKVGPCQNLLVGYPSNYLSHHLAGIVTAAVFSDAAHIVEEIALLKTRTSGAAGTTAAADPIE